MDSEHISIIDKAYGFASQGHIQTRDGIVFSARNNIYILKTLNENETKKLFTYSVQEHLFAGGFLYIDKILLTQDNHLSIQLNDKKYYCTVYPKGNLCNIENIEEVKFAAAILAKMHNYSIGFTPQRAIDIVSNVDCNDNFNNFIKFDSGNLITLFKHRSDELLRFKKSATKSKNMFDYEYLSVADYFYSISQNACTALTESSYLAQCEMYSELGAICHKNYTSHNVVLNNQNNSIINFDSASIDLPLLDLYNILKQRMKKCGWNSTDAYEIINEYDKYRNVSEKDIEIIKILFDFPQKIWRIVNKYYNSRKAWCEKSCLLKLEDVKNERKKIESFLKNI